MCCSTMAVESLWETYPTVCFHYLVHRQRQTIPYYVLIIWWSCIFLKHQVLTLILYHWPDYHIWCCLLTTNGAIILCALVLDHHTWCYTVSMKSPSCPFSNTMLLVINGIFPRACPEKIPPRVLGNMLCPEWGIWGKGICVHHALLSITLFL